MASGSNQWRGTEVAARLAGFLDGTIRDLRGSFRLLLFLIGRSLTNRRTRGAVELSDGKLASWSDWICANVSSAGKSNCCSCKTS